MFGIGCDHGSFDNRALWLTALVYHCQAIRFGSCSSASPCIYRVLHGVSPCQVSAIKRRFSRLISRPSVILLTRAWVLETVTQFRDTSVCFLASGVSLLYLYSLPTRPMASTFDSPIAWSRHTGLMSLCLLNFVSNFR